MKHAMLLPGIIAVVAAICFLLAGCAGNDPKALAKQTYDLGIQAVSSLLEPSKIAEIEKKAAAIKEKVRKLSAKDKVVYDQELIRLTGQAVDNLLNYGSGILNSGKDALERQAQDILNDLGLQDAAQKALENAQKAADTIKNQDKKNIFDSAKQILNQLGSSGN